MAAGDDSKPFESGEVHDLGNFFGGARFCDYGWRDIINAMLGAN
jgi:hypothetical protein